MAQLTVLQWKKEQPDEIAGKAGHDGQTSNEGGWQDGPEIVIPL